MSKINWKSGNMLYPLPVVMVSCQRKDERPNIITVAWAGTICSDPVMVSISVRKERFSHGIIAETGEFVINLVTQDLVYATDYCGVKSGRDVDKFKMMNLTPVAINGVKAKAIGESPLSLACRVKEIKELGSHDMFLAEVTAVSVRKDLLDDTGALHLEKAGLIAYSHGLYHRLGEVIGFFGWSVARPEVLEKRMAAFGGK